MTVVVVGGVVVVEAVVQQTIVAAVVAAAVKYRLNHWSLKCHDHPATLTHRRCWAAVGGSLCALDWSGLLSCPVDQQ